MGKILPMFFVVADFLWMDRAKFCLGTLPAKRREANYITYDGNEIRCIGILYTKFEKAATFLTI